MVSPELVLQLCHCALTGVSYSAVHVFIGLHCMHGYMGFMISCSIIKYFYIKISVVDDTEESCSSSIINEHCTVTLS